MYMHMHMCMFCNSCCTSILIMSPQTRCKFLVLGAAAIGLVGTSIIMYYLPFPNVLLKPDFRWAGQAANAGDGDGGGSPVDDLGVTVLKFQVVLAGYSLAFGLWYSGSSTSAARSG